jgi:hypothetical protein
MYVLRIQITIFKGENRVAAKFQFRTEISTKEFFFGIKGRLLHVKNSLSIKCSFEVTIPSTRNTATRIYFWKLSVSFIVKD